MLYKQIFRKLLSLEWINMIVNCNGENINHVRGPQQVIDLND